MRGRIGEVVTIIYDCPIKQCDKLWLRDELIKREFRVTTVTPCLKLSQIEQRGKIGKLLFYILTFWQCVKALLLSRNGETVLCWSQWSGLFFNLLPGSCNRKIISFNWLTPTSGQKTRCLYTAALSNSRFTAIINSEKTRDRIRQVYGAGEEKRLVYIPDVYDDREPFSVPVFRTGDRYCFIGGRANRDWDLFLKLAEICPDINFVAVSARTDWKKNIVITPNVQLKFDVSAQEYYRLLGGAFITIFPLKEDKVSGLINIVKSVQMGKLVLTTNVSATAMYYPDECKDSLLPVGNLVEWKNKLYEVYGYTEQEYTKRAELMQKHIQKNFSPAMAGEKLAQMIYESYGF